MVAPAFWTAAAHLPLFPDRSCGHRPSGRSNFDPAVIRPVIPIPPMTHHPVPFFVPVPLRFLYTFVAIPPASRLCAFARVIPRLRLPRHHQTY